MKLTPEQLLFKFEDAMVNQLLPPEVALDFIPYGERFHDSVPPKQFAKVRALNNTAVDEIIVDLLSQNLTEAQIVKLLRSQPNETLVFFVERIFIVHDRLIRKSEVSDSLTAGRSWNRILADLLIRQAKL